MIFHSSSSSGPGLLMISFGTAILPTSWSSAANSTLRRWRGSRPSRSATAEREFDDAAAVAARCRRRRPRPRRRAAARCPGRPRSARAPGRCAPGARARAPRGPRRAGSRARQTAGPIDRGERRQQADRGEGPVEGVDRGQQAQALAQRGPVDQAGARSAVAAKSKANWASEGDR